MGTMIATWRTAKEGLESVIRILDVAVTGNKLQPTTTTGNIYAKIIPNIVAYGPRFLRQSKRAHLLDEWMDLDDLLVCAKRYCTALYMLRTQAGA